mmetsp:Transcript_16722/g.45270  ORF Transcript_16722/g.45270 Transcript_16722/m.45270 type:complete len:241 (-) Transcript_16722:1-723(-)
MNSTPNASSRRLRGYTTTRYVHSIWTGRRKRRRRLPRSSSFPCARISQPVQSRWRAILELSRYAIWPSASTRRALRHSTAEASRCTDWATTPRLAQISRPPGACSTRYGILTGVWRRRRQWMTSDDACPCTSVRSASLLKRRSGGASRWCGLTSTRTAQRFRLAKLRSHPSMTPTRPLRLHCGVLEVERCALGVAGGKPSRKYTDCFCHDTSASPCVPLSRRRKAFPVGTWYWSGIAIVW